MVWSQYVYEAEVGLDVVSSDDDIEHEFDSHLNIHDWGVEYSDELWYLWDTIRSYLYDAMLENILFTNATFTDFEEFCYIEHGDNMSYGMSPYNNELYYIWTKILQYLEEANLQGEFMRNARFEDFVDFVMIHTDNQNNIVL